jgi:hypothetical protein
MPLNLQVGDSTDFKIYVKTGAAPAGATFAAVSSDTTQVTFAPDATPQPVSNGEGANANPPVPDGAPTVFSGNVASIAPNPKFGTPVPVTFTQTNPDGTTIVLNDTVTPSETETLGDIFGAQVTSVTQAAANKSVLVAHVIPPKAK